MTGTKIGILFNDDVSDKYQLQQLIEKNFDVKSTEIHFLGFSRHRYDRVEKPDFVFIKKDFSMFGQPKSEVISEFMSHDYKLLFNFFGKDELCLEIVAQFTKAKLKVGLNESNQKINDLSFALDSRNLDFFKESSKYIKQII
jgi:predicted nucleotidyltransferase